MRKTRLFFIVSSLLIIFTPASATRIKDITNIAGIRENQLIGYGLVVGLTNTGDRVNQGNFTQQTFRNMLLQFGIRIPIGINLQLQNVAAVAINASLPPFANLGQKIDVTISSLGNASSLRGGELLLTPLRGADGQVYAMAQGAIVVSGFGAQGGDGSKVIVNVPSSGRIPNGATVEKTIEMPYVKEGAITFELKQPDFTTAEKVQLAINKEFGKNIARALNASDISVKMDNFPFEESDIPVYQGDGYSVHNLGGGGYKGDGDSSYNSYGDARRRSELSQFYQRRLMRRYVPVIARIENINVEPAEVSARVIVNSRTGTIVVGQNVFISPVAVSHGNLSVVISESPFVSQPNAFANGRTVTGTASNINVNQNQNHAFVFAPGASLQDLVNAINAVGAAPGDLIAILEAIKSAGALHATMEVI